MLLLLLFLGRELTKLVPFGLPQNCAFSKKRAGGREGKLFFSSSEGRGDDRSWTRSIHSLWLFPSPVTRTWGESAEEPKVDCTKNRKKEKRSIPDASAFLWINVRYLVDLSTACRYGHPFSPPSLHWSLLFYVHISEEERLELLSGLVALSLLHDLILEMLTNAFLYHKINLKNLLI